MTTLRSRATLISMSCFAFWRHYAYALEIGDAVCTTGYIMDHYCIENTGGKLLDDSSVVTLQNPEKHSFHCLLDVSLCYESGFQVLGEKDTATDRHCLGFRLDDDSADAVLTAGRALGKKGPNCSTCTSTDESAPEFGYRATVKGTVKELGDGSDGVAGTPMLTDVQLLDASVECDGNSTVSPGCTVASAKSGGRRVLGGLGGAAKIAVAVASAALVLIE